MEFSSQYSANAFEVFRNSEVIFGEVPHPCESKRYSRESFRDRNGPGLHGRYYNARTKCELFAIHNPEHSVFFKLVVGCQLRFVFWINNMAYIIKKKTQNCDTLRIYKFNNIYYSSK